MRYSNDQEEIKDWIQDIYIRLWETRQKMRIDSIDNFKAYFIVTARNYANKSLAGKRRLQATQFQDISKTEIANVSYYNELEEVELRHAYQQAISRLPVKTRNAYVLNREMG